APLGALLGAFVGALVGATDGLVGGVVVGATVGEGGGVVVSVGNGLGSATGEPLGDPDAVGEADEVGDATGEELGDGLALAHPVRTGPKPPHCGPKSPFWSCVDGTVATVPSKSPAASWRTRNGGIGRSGARATATPGTDWMTTKSLSDAWS